MLWFGLVYMQTTNKPVRSMYFWLSFCVFYICWQSIHMSTCRFSRPGFEDRPLVNASVHLILLCADNQESGMFVPVSSSRTNMFEHYFILNNNKIFVDFRVWTMSEPLFYLYACHFWPPSEPSSWLLSSRNSVVGILYLYALSSKE